VNKLEIASIVFKYLSQAPLQNKVELAKRTFYMDEDGELCIKGYNETKGEEIFLVAFERLREFTSLCEGITEEELVRITGSMSLKNGGYINE